MADTLKVLGQSCPAAATLTDMYTVPASTSAVCSSLIICNQSLYTTTYRASIAVAGAANEAKQYVVYDSVLGANETMTMTLGVSLATTDVVRVQSGNGLVSFLLFGVEVT